MKLSINKFLENPKQNSNNYSNYYDWFGKDTSLERKMLTFVSKLKFLVNQGIIDGDKNYVWFKENCPCCGSLYSDMRISSLNNDHDFLGGFAPRVGYSNAENLCNVWWFKDGNLVQKEFENWSTFKKEVKNNSEFKKMLTEAYKLY